MPTHEDVFEELECHGFRFDHTGTCTFAPCEGGPPRQKGLVTHLRIGSFLRLIAIDTPIDRQATWRWVRYYNDLVPVPVLGRLLVWPSASSTSACSK